MSVHFQILLLNRPLAKVGEAIAAIAPFTHRIPDRTTLQRHADMIERGSVEGIAEELDYKNVKERYLAAVKAIGQA